jgi:hypothetical protein
VTDESGEIYHISVKAGKSLMDLLDLMGEPDAETLPYCRQVAQSASRVE